MKKLQNNAHTHIALGLSGGVDSATSAALLLSEGYKVTGVTCVFMDGAASDANVAAAEAVCRHLGIDHVVYDAQGVFDSVVVKPFIEGCYAGLTPSPCVTCNRFCKIPVLEKAAEELGCSRVATGHYARVVQMQDTGRWGLKRPLDESKDQTYMLSLLTQEQLSRLVLPLGGFTKMEVRTHAEALGIPVAKRPESQDLCFVEAGQDYREFLKAAGVDCNPGNIVLRSGEVVGTHDGLHRYTIGQRKGLGVAMGQPFVVVDKDINANTLTIAPRNDAQVKAVEVANTNWMITPDEGSCFAKIRYRMQPARAMVLPVGEDRFRVEFFEPQQLTAPGQCCAFYQGNLLLGGGIIDTVIYSE